MSDAAARPRRSGARSAEPGPAQGGRRSQFLSRACREAADRVAEARRRQSLAALRDRAARTPVPPAFGVALAGGIIAEIKRASPSRGVIAADRDAASQARAYAAGGAAAVSVLTEPRHFGGSLDDLWAVTAAVDVPVLRKDFVVDVYQVVEARAAGAAATLLLVAALDDDHLVDLLGAAAATGIEALIETHTADEVARARAAIGQVRWDRAPVVGINARDLRRLSVDRSRFAELVDALPDHAVVVAESGVGAPADVAAYRRAGADAVLVGEHLMRADDPEAATHDLVAAARGERTAHAPSALIDPS